MNQPAASGASPSLADVVWVVAAATLAQTVVSMGTSMLPVIAPKLAQSLAIDPAWIGMQVSIVYACGALCGLVAGGMVKRLGACRAMQLALIASACGAAVASAASVAAVALASTLLGAAIGLVHPPAAQLMLRFSPPSQLNLIFSIKQTGVPLGITLSALIGPPVAISLGWQWSLALIGTLAVALGIALQMKRSTWDADRASEVPMFETPFAGLGIIWCTRQLRYLVLTGAAYSALQVSVSTFAVTMLVGEIGYGLIYAGLLTSLITFSGMSARLVFGWAADRLSRARAILAVMGVGMLVCCLLLGALDAGWPSFAVMLLFVGLGITLIGWNGILHAEVARLSPQGTVSVVASGVSFFIYAAIAVTPTFAALLYKAFGKYALMFAALSTLAVAGLILLRTSARAATYEAR
jgi:MFS family permease